MADGGEVSPTAAAAADSEELEPLFDYSRVRPTFDFRFDDSDLEKSDIFVHCNKRPKLVDAVADDADAVEGDKDNAGVKKAAMVNLDDEDWLATPPLKPVACKDKIPHETRLEKQEVEKLVEDTFQKVVETVQKDLASKKPPESIVLDELTEPEMKKSKEKILIIIQDKDAKHPFRVCKDERFDKLFKAYAKKFDLDPSNLAFVFDGEKIKPTSTPRDLDLEDEDMVEVLHKPAEHVILDKPTVQHVKKAREPIVIMVQGIDGKQPFRIYKDDKFDKIFNAYAKKVKLSPSNLTFTFDGEKINSASTPQDLDLEDDDMIEVSRKSS